MYYGAYFFVTFDFRVKKNLCFRDTIKTLGKIFNDLKKLLTVASTNFLKNNENASRWNPKKGSRKYTNH